MVALIVAMGIMAVMMSVAMPVWKQTVQREKEEELVFRGLQYARAIGLFQRKYANAAPPNLDVLVEQRFLRQKYKDPMTRADFLPLLAGQAVTITPPGEGRGGSAPAPGTLGGTSQPGQPAGTPAAGTTGGIVGVASRSKDRSIRIYNGRTHYNEWAFVYTAPAQTPGAGAPGTTAPDQRGQSGQSGAGPVGQGNDPNGRGRTPPNGPGRQGGPGGPVGQGPGSGIGNLGDFNPQQPSPTPRGR